MASLIDLEPIQKEHIVAMRSFLNFMGISSEIDPHKNFEQTEIRHRLTGVEGINSRGSCLKLEGTNIDVILYVIEQIIDSYGLTDEWQALCIYGVECNIGQGEKDPKNLKAGIKKKTKGLFRKEIVDFWWAGGQIADVLNQDTSLKGPLLAYLINTQTTGKYADMSLVPVLPPSDEEIKGETIRLIEQGVLIVGCATHSHKKKTTPLLLPSRDAFRAYVRIAKHIRDYVP